MAAADASGNVGTATYQVFVQKGNSDAAIDDGAVYTVESTCEAASGPAMAAAVDERRRVRSQQMLRKNTSEVWGTSLCSCVTGSNGAVRADPAAASYTSDAGMRRHVLRGRELFS